MSVYASLALILLLAVTSFAGDRITGRPFATRSEVIAQHGAAATSHPLATQAAIEILRKGGSAVDAAIAANACLTLMEPTGSGLGGDLFAIVWDPESKKLHGLNGSGRSAAGLSYDELIQRLDGRDEMPSHGPLPVTVPGCVDGWFALHERFGRLPMRDVLAPAIGYARDGFPVTALIGYYWERSTGLRRYPGFEETFLPGGRAPREGEIFRNPGLARTLEKLAAGGRSAFYEGELAEGMDAFFRRVDCPLRREDLAAHHAEWIDPVSTNYRGFDVWELPPNGQGIAALQMLNILEGYDLRAMGHNSAAYLHHLIEAKKLAFEDRARYYADPAFSDVPVGALISKDYAAKRRALLDPRAAGRAYPPGDLADADRKTRDSDTVFLTTADDRRMMVALIQSNYRGFGSGLCPDGLGFCLQDRGELFSLDPTHPNVYAPGKRPFHTIIPAFITKDGKPYMSFGVMGGDMQPQGHVQIVCNLVDFGMNTQEAGDAARFYHTGSTEPTGRGDAQMREGGKLALESEIGAEVRRALEQMGHRIEEMRGPFGGYQAILYDEKNGVYRAASESRKDGMAAGY